MGRPVIVIESSTWDLAESQLWREHWCPALAQQDQMEARSSETAVSHIEVAGMSVGKYSSLEQIEKFSDLYHSYCGVNSPVKTPTPTAKMTGKRLRLISEESG